MQATMTKISPYDCLKIDMGDNASPKKFEDRREH